MRRYEKEKTFRMVLDEVTCDRCKHSVRDTGTESMMEVQEFVIVRGQGGYASQHWGDGTSWSVDLCEKCQHELFGAMAHINRD
jgi:hypothetical protein